MRKYLKLSLFVLMAVALISTCAIGCGGGTQEEKEAYKIGAIFSTTGGNANLGVPEENTVNMIVDKINADGGINGHPLEIIVYNDETDAAKTATLANTLIEQDEVLAIIGSTGTGQTMAMLDAVTTAEIPLVSCAAGIGIVEPVADRYWIFKTPQADRDVVNELYKYMESINITKVAIITSTSGYGASGRNFLLSVAANYSITIVDDQTFASTDTSMISQLTHIKGTDAEAVICWDTDQASAVVAKDMQTLQFTIPLYCSHGVANPGFLSTAGDAANGVIISAGKLLIVDDLPDSDAQKEILASYKEEYEAEYGEGTINTFGGHAYDALYIIVEALEDMDEDLSLAESRAAIRDGLEQITNFVGISGIFTMTTTNHLGMQTGSLVMIEIVDGDWTWMQ
jgi:branched-chain amino acid transport system substrate-binding protein